MIFKCDKGVIQEHVYIDASQGSAPKEADCSGSLKYVMPIENGCNNYAWGSMYMAWEGFCEAPKSDDKDEKGEKPTEPIVKPGVCDFDTTCSVCAPNDVLNEQAFSVSATLQLCDLCIHASSFLLHSDILL